jgi:hypothetical protein
VDRADRLRDLAGGSSEFITVFEARGLSAVPAFLRSEEEAEIELRWVELDELVDAALDGRLHTRSCSSRCSSPTRGAADDAR